ncbi:undecaprenyl-diphosphate phosphatase [Candidatus Bipolaricaulota bacterium]|jgi:undecaprenyl-diphosphatase|nr:undecaprenyl-diphosphate phosphatase [Candidatus Bipolaricaulota bacterium]TFH09448.1 MAG: undecaprenyl-diphosphate phosphatase [Candidatus Atribacteria bacterium]
MIRYALLGLVQGLTEFLPVSSSGHLVLAQRWLGLDPPGVLLEAMLHWGTLAAVLVVFRRDIVALLLSLRGKGRVELRKDAGFLIAGTVPLVTVALLFREGIQSAFSSTMAIGVGLLVTAAVLCAGHFAARGRNRHALIRFPDALGVGLAQAAAVFPGISRSGLTISAGHVLGLTAAQAVRFAFLLSIPALFGAGLLHLLDALETPQVHDWLGLTIGASCAFASGWLSLRAALALVMRGKLWVFAIYCLLLGSSVLAWSALA